MGRNDSGFGIVTVMIGAVTLGIFALVYVQSAQNRANFSQITNLMSFREQVMTYYGSVVANRGTWECTVQGNSGLKNYLVSGGANKSGSLNIRDYTGNCQEGFGSGAGAELIPTAGLGLKLQDYNDIPLASARSCTGAQFCLKATWKGLDTGVGQRRAVELKLTLTANRDEIKQQLGVNFELSDKEQTVYMNRTVATDCSDSRVTGNFPGTSARHPAGTGVIAYAGDAAVVSLDALTGLVSCSPRGPLVVPPCYDVTSTSNNPFLSSTGMRVNGVDSGRGFGDLRGVGLRCDGRGRSPSTPIQGSCPRTSGGGTTAIAYFDPQTGIAQCSHPNILVEEVVETVTADVCDGNAHHGIVLIRSSGSRVGTFQCSSDRWSNRQVGVQPGKGRCGTEQAISEFGSDGAIDSCIDSDGRGAENAMRGLSGPQGEHGDSAAWLHAECRRDSNCTHQYRNYLGYGNYETHPTGPGVSWRPGPRGPDRPCPTGCWSTSYLYPL